MPVQDLVAFQIGVCVVRVFLELYKTKLLKFLRPSQLQSTVQQSVTDFCFEIACKIEIGTYSCCLITVVVGCAGLDVDSKTNN